MRILNWFVILVAGVVGCTPATKENNPSVAPASSNSGNPLEVALAEPKNNNDPAGRAIDPATLKFSAADVKNRFFAFDKAARDFAKADYQHRPYRLGGNFVTAVWHKGCGATEPITLRGPRDQLKPIHRIEVDAIVIPVPDQALSASLAVETIEPVPDKWCVSLYYRQGNGGMVTSEGWSIDFYRWDPAQYQILPFRPRERAKDLITLPARVDSGGYVYSGPLPPRSKPTLEERFLAHVRSAEAMRDFHLAELKRLEKFVIAAIEAHKFTKWVYDKSPQPNLPPPRHEVPLTAAEEKDAIAKAMEYYAAQSKLILDHYKDCYAALRKSFPLEKCWPELALK